MTINEGMKKYRPPDPTTTTSEDLDKPIRRIEEWQISHDMTAFRVTCILAFGDRKNPPGQVPGRGEVIAFCFPGGGQPLPVKGRNCGGSIVADIPCDDAVAATSNGRGNQAGILVVIVFNGKCVLAIRSRGEPYSNKNIAFIDIIDARPGKTYKTTKSPVVIK